MLVTIFNAQIPHVKGRNKPYNHAVDIRVPDDDEIDLPHIERKYRQLVGDIQYLSDRTRPDLEFETEGLAMASHRPTFRHY